MADEQVFVSITDTVNMVSKNYSNLGEMMTAYNATTDPHSRNLLKLSVLVHVYLKIGKPEDMKQKIVEIWDGLFQE